MRDAIHQLNIQHYRRVLMRKANDPAQCQPILKLLAEEEAKLQKQQAKWAISPVA